MRFNLKHAALVAACAAAFPVHATNGYFLPGFGIRAQGMGGVGIAYGRDSLSTAANPANAVNTGMRGDMGFAVFNPERSARVYDNGDPSTGAGGFGFDYPDTAESDAKYFPVPEMGFSMGLTDKLHLAFAVVGNGGMNTTYRENFFSLGGPPAARSDKLGVDMMQLLAPVSLAYKVNENHAVGASLVLAATRFRAYGLAIFDPFGVTRDPANLTDKGFDYSYGAGIKLGWLGEFMDDKLTVGLSYASRTYMTKLDKYRGLFAEQGDFDIPESYGIGIAIKPVKNLVIAADVLRINYNDIASIGNLGPGDFVDGSDIGIPAYLDDFGKQTGTDIGMGFGWNNMTVYKLGVQYGVNKRLQVRAGLNYGKSPIPNNQVTFNTLAPATVERHYSVGFTYRPNDELEVTGTYMYVAPNTQKACNQNIVDCVEIGMHQNVFGLSLGWVLDPGAKSLDEFGAGDWAGINFDGWYGGFGFGQSRYGDDVATTANTRTEGWKVYSGYQFNKYLGVEGGYVNLNDYTGQTGTIVTNTASNGWMLAAVGAYPLTAKLSVTAKLGAAYVLTKTNTTDTALDPLTIFPVLPTQRSGEDSYVPNYGVGVKYALFNNVDLRAEWERFDLGNNDINKSNIDLMTAGFAVKF